MSLGFPPSCWHPFCLLMCVLGQWQPCHYRHMATRDFKKWIDFRDGRMCLLENLGKWVAVKGLENILHLESVLQSVANWEAKKCFWVRWVLWVIHSSSRIWRDGRGGSSKIHGLVRDEGGPNRGTVETTERRHQTGHGNATCLSTFIIFSFVI